MRLNGTLRVRLANEVRSADGKHVYPAGSLVNVAIHADADVRVWEGDKPPVLATFKELVGSRLAKASMPDSDHEQTERGSLILNRLVPAPDHGAGFRRDPETGFVYYSSEWLGDESASKPPE